MKDSCIREINIEDFASSLVQKNGGRRTPLSGTLEPTFRCNNRCVHCYVNKDIDDNKERERELAYTEITRILDDLAEAGCLSLLLTGGEPLVREDFADIYLYAKKKGFLITVFTNGTLITPRVADLFKEFPPRSIEITVYGATERTYENVTRSPGSYSRCMKGIDLLLGRNLPLKLKTVITTLNSHEFADIKRFVEELGLEFRFDALINGRIDGSRDMAPLRIPPREVVQLDLSDPARGPEFVRLYQRTREMEVNPKRLFRCGAGMNSFHIDPYGHLMICNMVRTPWYDLGQGSFGEGWNEFLPRLRQKRFVGESKCQHCRLISFCDQCPGWSQLEHGDLETPVEYLCRVTHLRAEAYGIGRAASTVEGQDLIGFSDSHWLLSGSNRLSEPGFFAPPWRSSE
ncbi:MAG: radical SAM protein [Deltaproteobacteria bacterium]|nr:radical SAM protein [Deltaproteobacteria bacterium]